MSIKQDLNDWDDNAKARAIALGKALRTLREARQLSRAELLDRFYSQLQGAGIDYKVKGDWWLSSIENGDKAKQLPREYINAFIGALECTKLEAVGLFLLADLNTLNNSSNSSYTIGLTYVITELFTTALSELEDRIDEETAVRLDEREWMEIGRAVLEVVVTEHRRQR